MTPPSDSRPSTVRDLPAVREAGRASDPARPLSFHIETFGCQMNTADSEEMARGLRARGLVPALGRDDADWVVVNTCTVRDHAEHRALSYLGRLTDWKDAAPGRRIVFAGCAAERLGPGVRSRFPQVDRVAGARAIDAFDGVVRSLLPADGFDAASESFDAWGPGADYTAGLGADDVTAFVTVMRGCNYSCTYCIVPSVRGRELYRPSAGVLEEVRQKAAAGLSEVLLLGQTVNSYRPTGDPLPDFAALLTAVDAVPGVRRVRFMSPHPFYVDAKFAAALAAGRRVCPHIHLPVQSGSDAVLRRMRRNYDRRGYLQRLELMRAAAPGLSVTTDFIAGFPGESEADFRETLSLVEEAGFDSAYCFKYSPRPGTESAALADDVAPEVKEERLARLLEATEALSRRRTAALLGSRQEVLLESAEPSADGGWRGAGRARTFWKISVTSDRPLRRGETLDVVVTETQDGALRARPAAA
jgi:tRNA-2-methylthio-N6-dimethylallyladenosine synthase